VHLDTNNNSYRTVLIVGDKHEIFGFEIPMSDVHAVDTRRRRGERRSSRRRRERSSKRRRERSSKRREKNLRARMS
jgi:hypothetical protein